MLLKASVLRLTACVLACAIAAPVVADTLHFGKVTLDLDMAHYLENAAKISAATKVASSSNLSTAIAKKAVVEKNVLTSIKEAGKVNLNSSEAYIDDIRYQRSLNNGGVLKLLWKKQPQHVEFSEHKNALLITLKNTRIADYWLHNIDTTVFNTIVNSIDLSQEGNNVVIVIHTAVPFNFTRKTTDKMLEVDLTNQQTEVDGFNVNKKISLKFQDVSVRALLQTMAQFAGLNLVVSEGVEGNVSLNLNQVPWEEALNIILVSKGLGKRLMGNILYIAPNAEIAAQDQEATAAQKANQAAAPLVTEYIHLNYAKAEEVMKVIEVGKTGFLSSRGSIATDERTNTIVITDTKDYINSVRAMIENLDEPVDQVLIEARIVEVSRKSAFDLGLGYTADNKKGSTISILPNYLKPSDEKKGSTNATLAFSGLFGGIDLSLELSALETEGDAKIVSSPHLVVAENTEAYIKQGKEIPYNESSASGAASIAFKEAVLELKVKPQVAPNGHVILDVTVKKDAPSTDGTTGSSGEPALDKREIETKLMVKNGQTVVLGGIYEKTVAHSKSKVPFLGDIPLLGWLFSSVSNSSENKELLIFITPKIIKQETL
ncbi:type IV pilus secretin PilQ [Cysteiniphilum litorale]|uniref:type IV pilus secretin PilQ n=1 Tax=Cysteiniphilum litorale TaxID=2056700 RepID=UPI003F881D00